MGCATSSSTQTNAEDKPQQTSSEKAPAMSSSPAAASSSSPSPADANPLSPAEFRPFTLAKVTQELYNVKRFRFSLKEGQSLNLPVASCIVLNATIDGEDVNRPYTPVSTNAAEGFFDLLIKIYHDGKMTQHLDTLQVGQSINIKGPFNKIQYPFKYTHIGMLAGGTGLTPMLQTVQAILSNPEDKTQVSLIFANNTPRDIMLRQELLELQKTHADQFKVHFVVADGEGNWNEETDGSIGFISKEILDKYLFVSTDKPASELSSNTETHGAFVCGPPPFMKFMSGDKEPDKSQGKVAGYLKDLGFSEENVYKF